VVEVQVGVDDHVDVLGGESPFGQGVEQPPRRHGVGVAKLLVLLGTNPRVHKEIDPPRACEENPRVQKDAVALVGGSLLLPKDAGNDAEHGAPVQTEGSGGEGMDLDVADLHGSSSTLLARQGRASRGEQR
jgi:hypothetical protein